MFVKGHLPEKSEGTGSPKKILLPKIRLHIKYKIIHKKEDGKKKIHKNSKGRKRKI
jgi:hypothetical protein